MTLPLALAGVSTRNSTAEAQPALSPSTCLRTPFSSALDELSSVGTDWFPAATSRSWGRVETIEAQNVSSQLVRPHPLWRGYIERRLRQMSGRTAEPGYPTTSVLEAALSTALRIFKANTPTPSVVPSEDGGVQLVWHKAGWDIELEVARDGEYVWARNRMTGEQWDGELASLLPRLSELLGVLAT